MPPNPWLSWDYLTTNWPEIQVGLVEHATITVQAVGLALLLAVPLAGISHEFRWLAGPVLATTSTLYTVPSLALFALLVPFTGIGRLPVLIGLVLYALLLLIRNILTGLTMVDRAVRDAATGLGYGRWRRLLLVEGPMALPSVITGVRLATVSTVALVTVGYIAGFGGLGQIMFRGFAANYRAQVLTATLLCVVMAAVFDVAIVTIGRLIAPWIRRREANHA